MLKAFSVLQQVAASAATAASSVMGIESQSSDEEEGLPEGDEADLVAQTHSSRGVLTFCAYSQSQKEKLLHIHLQRGVIVQTMGAKRKLISVADIHNISRHGSSEVVLEIKKSTDMQMHHKKLFFADEKVAYRFHQYVEFISEAGKVLRSAFHQIDVRRTGRISEEDLKRALARVDLIVSLEDVQRM